MRRGIMFLIFSCLFISCENPLIQQIVEPRTVAFESNGGSGVENQTVFKGQPVKRPSDPSRNSFNFIAWYSDNKSFLEEWNFAAIPNGDITLYAKWEFDGDPVIRSAAITVISPITDVMPNTTASGAGNFTIGAVSWSPDDNPFIGGVKYTASVTLTAHQYYTFAPELTGATVNGNAATVIDNTESALTISYTFPPTKAVTGVAITAQPKLSYVHGDTLDLSGLVVTFTYNDATTEDAALGDFASRGISANPAHGVVLSRSTHDGGFVTITYGSFEPMTTNALTLSPADPAVTWPAGLTAIYGQTLSAITLPGNIGTAGSFSWTEDDSTSAGNAGMRTHNMTFTPADTTNYNTLTQNVSVTVAKAAGAPVNAPTAAANGIGITSIELHAINLPEQNVEYGVNTGNIAPAIWQTGTTFGGLTAGTAYYFFARSAANDNYNAGAASAGREITTHQRHDDIVTYWVDDTGGISIGTAGHTFPGNIVTVTNGGSITFTAAADGYTNHSWKLNGTDTGVNAAEYTFDTSDNDKEPGRNYIIGLTVKKGDNFYYAQITVRIEE